MGSVVWHRKEMPDSIDFNKPFGSLVWHGKMEKCELGDNSLMSLIFSATPVLKLVDEGMNWQIVAYGTNKAHCLFL